MRLAFVFDYNPFQISSAAALRYSSVIKELAKLGHEIQIYVLGSDSNMGVSVVPNIKITYCSSFKTTTLFRRRLWNYGLQYLVIESMIRKVSKLIGKGNFDLVWYSNSYAALKLLNYKKDKRAKHLLEITEYHDLHTSIIPDKNPLRRYFLKKEIDNFQKGLPKVDIGLFITKNLLDFYSSELSAESSSYLFPMVVDHKRFENIPRNGENKSVIRYMGSFSNEKDGIDILIKAFAIIVNDHKNLTLELAGGDHEDKPMQLRLIKELKLEDKIKYVGLIDRKEIPTYLSNALMLVLARPESKQAEGGFPTKLGEYLATGVPVCCTKVGEIPNYLEDDISVYFAKPGSEISFADTMRKVIENPELTSKVAKGGQSVAQNSFSAEVQTKKLVEFFETKLTKN